MSNTPSFQYYPADLMCDPEVMFWHMEMFGAYWKMITYLWINEGKFVIEDDKVRQLFNKKTDKVAIKLWERIKTKFDVKDGIVTHKRVTEEMQKQATYRLTKIEAGQKGGLAKAKNASTTTKSLVANPSSSSSSPSPSITTTNKEQEQPLVCCGQSSDLTPRAERHTKHVMQIASDKGRIWERPAVFAIMIRLCETHRDREIAWVIQHTGPQAETPGLIRDVVLKKLTRVEVEAQEAAGKALDGKKRAFYSERATPEQVAATKKMTGDWLAKHPKPQSKKKGYANETPQSQN